MISIYPNDYQRNLPVPHLGPVQPSRQLQVNPPLVFTQVPRFKHGLARHSSVSVNKY